MRLTLDVEVVEYFGHAAIVLHNPRTGDHARVNCGAEGAPVHLLRELVRLAADHGLPDNEDAE